MLQVIVGPPGAGKTYFSVWHLLNNFYTWDESLCWWKPKDANLVLLTNIDGFKLGDSLENAVNKAKGPNVFFTVPYIKQTYGDRPVVMIIDEAQRYFDYKFYDKQVLYYFQWHRHMGHSIYLITQDIECLAKGLKNLSETKIEAVRRSLSLMGEFRYKFFSGTDFKAECWKTKVLKRDQRVFAVYSSMSQTEVESTSSAPRRMMVWLVLLVVFVGSLIFWWRAHYFGSWSKGPRFGPSVAHAEVRVVPKTLPDALQGVKDARPGSGSSVGGSAVHASSGGSGGGVDSNPGGAPPIAPVPFKPGFVATGWGRVVAVFPGDTEPEYVVEENGEQYQAKAEDLVRLFRRHADGLRVGSMYRVWVFATTESEAREAIERAALNSKTGVGPQSPKLNENWPGPALAVSGSPAVPVAPAVNVVVGQ